MRWFAMFLPQFHEIAENNEWWGKGFTEWTHVKGATPLTSRHRQPIAPLNENYYNLMEKETVRWQTDLMHQYGVDGLVYYHYYFCGKKLLEKPAENLLNWTDIDQPFFFCWANHTWYQAKNGKKTVLLEQTYGQEADWRAHFDYLLPFFRDSRYEKKDNKPVFMIFQTNFPEKKDMLACFDRWCKDAGFDGIYVIETLIGAQNEDAYRLFRQKLSSQTQQIYVRQPSLAHSIYESKHLSPVSRLIRKIRRRLCLAKLLPWVQQYDGNTFYRIMEQESPKGEDLCHGLFFSWDNTPRHGVRGYVITPPDKETFLRYADSVKDDEYVFINAWNEWAEGMILEPTAHDGYKYLEWIKAYRDQEQKTL